MEYKCDFIDGTTLTDVWFQTVYKCIESGRDFNIDRGSNAGQKRLEFDFITIQVKHPEIRPLLPQIPAHYKLPNPVADDYLDQYMPYLMTGHVEEGEAYTYGQRLNEFPIDVEVVRNWDGEEKREIYIQDDEVWDVTSPSADRSISSQLFGYYLSQINLAIWTYKNKGFRNNQMCMEVGAPSDMLLQDPPCLRLIDTRIQDGQLHFIVYFRSWDLWGGFPANLAAIQLLKEHMALAIGVESGVTVAVSKGLHLYDYVWELAELLRGKSINDFREGK